SRLLVISHPRFSPTLCRRLRFLRGPHAYSLAGYWQNSILFLSLYSLASERAPDGETERRLRLDIVQRAGIIQYMLAQIMLPRIAHYPLDLGRHGPHSTGPAT